MIWDVKLFFLLLNEKYEKSRELYFLKNHLREVVRDLEIIVY